MEASRSPATFTFETPPHVMIVEARFYDEIADLQIQGVKKLWQKSTRAMKLSACRARWKFQRRLRLP